MAKVSVVAQPRVATSDLPDHGNIATLHWDDASSAHVRLVVLIVMAIITLKRKLRHYEPNKPNSNTAWLLDASVVRAETRLLLVPGAPKHILNDVLHISVQKLNRYFTGLCEFLLFTASFFKNAALCFHACLNFLQTDFVWSRGIKAYIIFTMAFSLSMLLMLVDQALSATVPPPPPIYDWLWSDLCTNDGWWQ